MVFTLELERLNTYYIRNLILPNAILLALSSLIFFLPCEACERIGFGVTVTLALCVNLLIVVDFVPETSKSIPNISSYFLASIFFSCISLSIATVSISVFTWNSKREDAKATAYLHDKAEPASGKNWCLNNLTAVDIAIGVVYLIGTTAYTVAFLLTQ